MRVLTVAGKDFNGVRRSQTLWAGAIALGFVAVLLSYANQGFNQSETEAVQSTFHFLTVVLSLLLPIVALVASYLAIAGERESGGIKFLLSLPNTRRDVFTGKLLSRLVFVSAGIGVMYIAATSVSLTKHGAFPAGVIVGTLLLTIIYGAVFVSIGISLSATVASRSKAIGRSLVAYFVLVLLYLFPVIQISNVVRELHTTILGMDANPDLYNAVEYTSPYLAYQKATNLAVPENLEQRFFEDSATNAQAAVSQAGGEASKVALDLPFYLSDEFSLVILAVWLVLPLIVGYRAFKGADLE